MNQRGFSPPLVFCRAWLASVVLFPLTALCLGQVPTVGVYSDKRCLDPAPGTITPGCLASVQPCNSGATCFWCNRKRAVSSEDMVCATEPGAQCQQLSTSGVTCGIRMDATCTVGADGIARCLGGVPSATAAHCIPAARCQ